MVLGCVIDIAKKRCVDPIVGYIGTEVGYLCSYSANLEKLIEEVKNLNDAKKRMEDRIEDAGHRSGETQVYDDVDRWLTNMARLIEEASRIIKEEDKETGRCLMGLRPNLCACYVASKSAKKVMDEAIELKKDGESITTVAHVDYSQALGCAIRPDFEELESRKEASEQIVAFLKDPSVKMVGMYGMGGAGKTTLAEKIGDQLFKDGTFRYVVKTDVSNNQKTDLMDIQKQIADVLKIYFGEEDGVKARANQLREQLVTKGKVLIILDDIWASFELTDVGIPVDRELKVLVTSRDLNVMRYTGSKHNVQLDILSDDDAWKLFDRMADGVPQHSDGGSTARAVVKQCGGIPVLLVTIARALRERNLATWKEALFQLKRFEGDKYVDDGYKRIEVSYNFLPDNELRSLFLLCSQLDHHYIPIDDLLKYTMGLGLFPRRKKLEEVSHRLHMHLGDLKSYCLLQDGNEEGTVRMHDVIHKFAAFVANRDHRMFTVAGGQLEEWPPKDELEQFSAISLPYCHQFPKAFDSSKLESFILLKSRDDARLYVPDKFFIGMKALKLVDLKRVSLSPVLSSSLNVLVKLRTLCLDNCQLDDIAMIGELPMLQVLSLMGSTISHVPKEIGSLGSSLKLLDLRCCDQLQVIASGVFSNLTLLEDLRIGKRSFNNWEQLQGCSSSTDHETTSTTTKKLASLWEFKNLGNLINIEIHIPDPKTTFPKDLVFEKLERFTITFGQKVHRYFKDSRLGSLGVNLVKDIQLYEGIKTLMGKANSLYLEEVEVKGVTSVCELDPKGFPELKFLTIENIAETQFMVKRGYNNCAVFPKLEYLKFISMRKLERIICDDHDCLFPVGSLQNLTTIGLSGCDVLKYLFLSRCLASHLLCLKEIKLAYCESMNAIIVDDDRYQLDEEEGEITHEFAQLRTLSLHDLPRLISFYSNTLNPIISSSQERQEKDPMLSSGDEIIKEDMLSSGDDNMLSSGDEIVEDNQRLLISLFNKKIVLPNLESLRLSEIEVDEIWDNQLAIEAERTNFWFQNLTILEVKECHSLSYLFTSSMVKSLAQLKKLKVIYCDSIEEIVAIKGEMTEDDVMLSFPALYKLELIKLPKFKRFCYANSSSTFFHKNVAFPNLEKLRIERLHQVKMIWGPEKIVKTQLHLNLRSMHVFHCPALTSIFPASIASLAFKQLELLSIKACVNLKEIVSEEKNEDEEEEDGAPTFMFFNFSLYLLDLPELERFYPEPHSSHWPNLKKLEVWNCDRLIDRNFNIDASFAKIIPVLKDCLLATTDIIVGYQSLSGYLHVDGRSRSRNFPISLEQLFQKFQKLEKVEVRRFSLEQLFPCEPHDLGDDDIHTQALAKTLAGAKHLVLTALPKMKRIWSEQYADDQFDGIPQNLEILRVNYCRSLMSLAPSTILFQNLTRLTVLGCDRLKKLIASYSTAKSLVNLTNMSVSDCYWLTEIVAIDDHHDHDGEEANNNSDHDTIVFGKLETLELRCLPSLASFCPTTYCNFQFPSLERVIVGTCPSMEFFSKGTLSTPRLRRVEVKVELFRFTKEEGHWEGDLNSTVQQLYTQRNANASLEPTKPKDGLGESI